MATPHWTPHAPCDRLPTCIGLHNYLSPSMAALVLGLAVSLRVHILSYFRAHAVKLCRCCRCCCRRVCLSPVAAAAASSGRLRRQALVMRARHHVLSDFLLVELKVVRVRVRGGDDEPDVPWHSERKPLKPGLGPCTTSVECFALVRTAVFFSLIAVIQTVSRSCALTRRSRGGSL